MRAVIVVLVALLAGCSSNLAGVRAGTLAGVKVGSVSCPDRLPNVQPKRVDDVDGVVQEFAVCALGGGDPARIGPQDERFHQLAQNLARVDVKVKGEVFCPAIARSLNPVYARTATGWWSLHQPVDACRQVQQPVADLLSSLFGCEAGRRAELISEPDAGAVPPPAGHSAAHRAGHLDRDGSGYADLRSYAPIGDGRTVALIAEGMNVLRTTFRTASGVAVVTDAMNTGVAGRLPWAELARRIDGVSGSVRFRAVVSPGTCLNTASPGCTTRCTERCCGSTG